MSKTRALLEHMSSDFFEIMMETKTARSNVNDGNIAEINRLDNAGCRETRIWNSLQALLSKSIKED